MIALAMKFGKHLQQVRLKVPIVHVRYMTLECCSNDQRIGARIDLNVGCSFGPVTLCRVKVYLDIFSGFCDQCISECGPMWVMSNSANDSAWCGLTHTT